MFFSVLCLAPIWGHWLGCGGALWLRFLGEYGREAPGGAVSSFLRVAVVALVVDFFGGFGVFCWHLAACGGRCCQWVGDLM